jgi:hypothetical protein
MEFGKLSTTLLQPCGILDLQGNAILEITDCSISGRHDRGHLHFHVPNPPLRLRASVHGSQPRNKPYSITNDNFRPGLFKFVWWNELPKASVTMLERGQQEEDGES